MSKLTNAMIALSLIISGCGEKAANEPAANQSNKTETPLPNKPLPRTLKAPNLGEAGNFAILAYASISSNSNSSINGKVGLFPGTKDQIELDPEEVAGGASDIIGSDDNTIPINLLSNAKVDMVTAYKEAIARTPDSDKIELNIEKLNGKNLSPGCYKWNSDLTISNDFALEGNGKDVWIFKIPANLRVSRGIQLKLRGGALAKNVFWQVAGSAILESNSAISGTIIAQQFIEMKSNSKLTGRAFAKNGYVDLDQGKIIMP